MAIKKFALFVFTIIITCSTPSIFATDYTASQYSSTDTSNKDSLLFANDFFSTYEDDPLLDISTPDPSFFERAKNWIIIRLAQLFFSANSKYQSLKKNSLKSLALIKFQLTKIMGYKKRHV